MVGLAAVAGAQAPNDEIPFAPFGPHSRFSIKWPLGSMYEGEMLVPLHLWSRTARIEQVGETQPLLQAGDCIRGYRARPSAAADSTGRGSVASGCTLAFYPHFVIRQLTGESAPVRSPSFNPAFELNYFVIGLDEHRTAGRPLFPMSGRQVLSILRPILLGAKPEDRTANLLGVHGRLGHYSNGQDRCLYRNPADSSCVGPGPPATLNTENGSFSTHYIEAGATLSAIAFHSSGNERRMAAISGSLRNYPGGAISAVGGMDSDLAETYGRWEGTGTLLFRWRTPPGEGGTFRKAWHLRIDGTCAYTRPPEYESCRGSVEGMLSFPGLYGLGVSARYVEGWDYYNTGYGARLANPPSGTPILAIVFDHSRAVTITQAARRLEAR
jgi:hypothetical protein